ncbi:hypothetical protein B0H11DRAFT_786322 [Mycena galericulata]|nr:hypothetical protein B0H11DRAFT_786322 [Mycena galericulata]
MISNYLLLASSLLGTFFVDALPAPKTTSIDLSSPPAGPVTIAYAGNNGSLWTTESVEPWPTQILFPQLWPEQLIEWNATQVSSDTWVFQSLGTGQWIQANATNNLIVAGDYPPTVFAVNSAGGGEFVIKLPNADLVWSVYDVDMEYGGVELEPSDGSVTQHWHILPIN